jgi:hypothetical protein
VPVAGSALARACTEEEADQIAGCSVLGRHGILGRSATSPQGGMLGAPSLSQPWSVNMSLTQGKERRRVGGTLSAPLRRLAWSASDHSQAGSRYVARVNGTSATDDAATLSTAYYPWFCEEDSR